MRVHPRHIMQANILYSIILTSFFFLFNPRWLRLLYQTFVRCELLILLLLALKDYAHLILILRMGIVFTSRILRRSYDVFILFSRTVLYIGLDRLIFLWFVCRKGVRLTYDTRTNMALFRSFTASEYVAAQRIRYDNLINFIICTLLRNCASFSIVRLDA